MRCGSMDGVRGGGVGCYDVIMIMLSVLALNIYTYIKSVANAGR